MEPPIQVTLAANAGVLLRVRNTSILIDALFADTSGCGPSPETRERLMSDLRLLTKWITCCLRTCTRTISPRT